TLTPFEFHYASRSENQIATLGLVLIEQQKNWGQELGLRLGLHTQLPNRAAIRAMNTMIEKLGEVRLGNQKTSLTGAVQAILSSAHHGIFIFAIERRQSGFTSSLTTGFLVVI